MATTSCFSIIFCPNLGAKMSGNVDKYRDEHYLWFSVISVACACDDGPFLKLNFAHCSFKRQSLTLVFTRKCGLNSIKRFDAN